MRRSVVPLPRREKKSALHPRSINAWPHWANSRHLRTNLNVLHVIEVLRAGINKRYEDKEQDRTRAHSGKVSR